MIFRSFRIAAVATAFAAVMYATPARADFEIVISSSAFSDIVITDGGAFDNSTADGTINVDTNALNLLLGGSGFTFSGLQATSNRIGGAASNATSATLTQSGQVVRDTTSGPATITITATDTDYTFPTGGPYTLSSSASDTFTNTVKNSADQRTFQSFFDPSNMNNNGGIPSTLLTFKAPGGTTSSTSGSSPDLALGTQPIPYALTNTTVITLGPSTNSVVTRGDQFTGATSVSAVPEPTSIALMLLGAPILAYRARRRMTVQA